MIIAFLLLFACSGEPEQCGFVKVAEMSPLECAQAGMVVAAQWAGEHPKERVAGYRCVVVATPEKDT